MPGMAWVMMSSRLGLVADVMATESPSQDSPVVIQRTCAVTSSVFLCSANTSVAAIGSPSSLTDPRQRIPDQLIHHPLAAKARLHQDHPGRLGAHLSDLSRALAARDQAQSGECRVGSLRRDEGDELALVRDVHRVDSQDLGGARDG